LKGSPGVTTFCVALAAHWSAQTRCVLLECDPSGGDLATRFSLASSPGLVSLAAAARRGSEPDILWQHTQELPGGLPVVAAPPGADHALAALTALAPESSASVSVLPLAARATDMTVIADCGRMDPNSPALAVVRSAHLMLLLSRAHADELAHLANRLAAVIRWSPRPALLLVGEGYSTAEVSRELDVPVFGRIPEDGPGAAVLRGHCRSRGGLSRSALGRAAGNVATALQANLATLPSPQRCSTQANRPGPVQRSESAAGHAGPMNGVQAVAPMVRRPTATTPDGPSRNGWAS
ncbi:MAG: chromosome partitioning protein, partial [Pseudonocardiaceae bacterium]